MYKVTNSVYIFACLLQNHYLHFDTQLLVGAWECYNDTYRYKTKPFNGDGLSLHKQENWETSLARWMLILEMEKVCEEWVSTYLHTYYNTTACMWSSITSGCMRVLQ